MEMLKLAFASPEINPVNHKARSIPLLNPVDRYGRVFFFSWLGFMVAFLSWYAFPPLLSVTIKKDLHMTQDQVANSNIVALLGTLLMRFIAGPLCDRFGPRYVFVGCLLCGAIPTAMAGLVTSPQGLIALRFFIGVLGATFVPCQVWCTGFFDKNVVGTANALAGGFGNAGGGITYFVMPAIYDSLVHSQGLTPHRAWRVAYVVPFIIIVALALSMLFLCEDTPTGKWSERQDNNTMIQSNIVDLHRSSGSGAASSTNVSTVPEKKGASTPQIVDTEAQPVIDISLANNEMIQKPTIREALKVIFSLPTLALALPYACSFGAELAINSILGAYYLKNFPSLGQTKSGRWAAMFGLVNVVFRPAGGFIADLIYRSTHSVWGKKVWLVCLGVCMGGAALAVGLLNPKSEGLMFGLVVLMAFFIAASNGANFAIVPHVHPTANGIVSGIVGGMGNFGGIVFAIIFRYNGTHYDRALWIIGAIVAGVNLCVSWIRPVPRT
ncbi:MFS transporter [Aspergillus novofumigatus IBT 16806]|uniref:Nitrate/nitrite transporter n=1 Tax=Aspergillus novofumigatus (strain IBT 16806) TaxID=1392255 RepID=A0A2I1C7E6_ASPN1|nr:nitrate transporter [Aspergillus novofumigatus IBT 16806]PKX93560.1 nitrate transporter [Aspergillus novofumigatus IBT 16806]